MKRLVAVALVLGLLVAYTAYAVETASHTASSTYPIPTSYSTALGSKILNGVSLHRNLHINNTTSTGVACFVSHNNGASAPNQVLTVVSEEIYVPATTAILFPGLSSSKLIYCRSTGSAITSGVLNVAAW